MMRDTTSNGFRVKLATFAENPRSQRAITVLIVINAITLGLETSEQAMAQAGNVIVALDRIILGIFVIELSIRIVAYGGSFTLGASSYRSS